MKSIIRSIFSLMVMGAMIAPFATLAEAGKCSPCQAAKSIRDALAQSIKDAQMAALAAGGSFARRGQADAERCGCSRTTRDEVSSNIEQEKCGCGCQKTCRDAISGDLEKCGCGCQKTCRDAVSGDLEKCGCQRTTRDEMAAVVAAAVAAERESELDEVPADASRAPREELADPCAPCGNIVDDSGCCPISKQLQCLGVCCNIVNQRVIALTNDSQKCCKRLREKTGHIENLIGDPDATVIDIPSCAERFSIVDVINSTDVDMMTWLKSIYVLLYLTYQCACEPCIEG